MGPAQVRVVGNCSVFGCDVSNSVVEVADGKILPFEPDSACRLDKKLGPHGAAWTSSPRLAGATMWISLARTLLSSAARSEKCLVVAVVGGTDRGKSSFSLFLANSALNAKLLPGVMDSDVGQADLGPPGVISAALIKRQLVDLRLIQADKYRFVGSTNPPGFEKVISRGISELAEEVKQSADICIINTDGYVENAGARYKAEILRKVQPDFVVVMGRIPLLRKYAGFGPWRFLFARSNRQGVKSPYLRARRRFEQFERFLGTTEKAKRIADLSFLFKDKIVDPKAPELFPFQLDGLFVGLGSRGSLTGFGLVLSSNQEMITFRTDVENFQVVYLGKIRVVPDNRDS